jgi:hypothetical protein
MDVEGCCRSLIWGTVRVFCLDGLIRIIKEPQSRYLVLHRDSNLSSHEYKSEALPLETICCFITACLPQSTYTEQKNSCCWTAEATNVALLLWIYCHTIAYFLVPTNSDLSFQKFFQSYFCLTLCSEPFLSVFLITSYFCLNATDIKEQDNICLVFWFSLAYIVCVITTVKILINPKKYQLLSYITFFKPLWIW